MEAAAERNDGARRIAQDETRQPRQGGRGIIWRQQHAAGRKARSLLEMQVGHRQHALLRPEQRPDAIGQHRNTANNNGAVRIPSVEQRLRPRVSRAPCHCIASLTSSASASAKSASPASPYTRPPCPRIPPLTSSASASAKSPSPASP